MSSIFIWDFHLTKEKYGEIKSKSCATFLRNKYTVFTMSGTVALRSVNKFFSGELQFCSYFRLHANVSKKHIQIFVYKYICLTIFECYFIINFNLFFLTYFLFLY